MDQRIDPHLPNLNGGIEVSRLVQVEGEGLNEEEELDHRRVVRNLIGSGGAYGGDDSKEG